MKTVAIVLFLILSTLSNNESIASEKKKGSGNIISQERKVEKFSAITVKGIAHVHLTQGTPQKVEVKADDNIIDDVTTKVNNEELIIDLNDDDKYDDIDVDVYVTVSTVEKLSISGVGKITTENSLKTKELDCIISGVGDIELKGEAKSQLIKITGVGNVSSFDFVTEQCDVVLTGVSNAHVHATKNLDVEITGMGNVEYKGNPEVTKNDTWFGRVKKRK